jgi:hypothetical protein
VLHFVSVHAHLVAADDGLETVLLAELPGDVGTELHAHASLAGPATLLLLGVGPQHLHHQACLARLPLVVSVELADVVEGHVVVGEETAVEDEVFLADQGG